MTALLWIFTAAASYLLGCFNGAILVSKYILRNDIRSHGSGNAGLTNFHRTFGGALMALVIASDVLKMVAAVLLGSALLAPMCGAATARLFAGMFCVLGHTYPATFGFRGGKGILSAAALVGLLDWRLLVLALAIFVLPIVITRWVSLGSVLAAAVFPIGIAVLTCQVWPAVLAVGTAALIIWRHKSNLGRIAAGTETRLTFRRTNPPNQGEGEQQ